MTRSVGFKNRFLPPVRVLRMLLNVLHMLRKLYQHFCALGDINPVPLSQDNACRYIAFLSQKLAYTSIKQCCSYNASGSRSCKPLSGLLAHRHAAQRYKKSIRDCT